MTHRITHNYFKKICLILLSIGLSHVLFSQSVSEISLKEAYEMYEERYPSIKNSELLNKIYTKELELLNNERLPGIFWKGDARLQSETIGFDTPEGTMTPFDIDIPLYSIKTYIEASYNIYDGGRTDAQKRLIKYQLEANLQDAEIEKYHLKERVNFLCINIQLLREQVKLLDYSKQNLNARMETLSAAVELGMILESELNKLEVKEIEIHALQENTIQQHDGLIDVLSQLLGLELSKTVKFNFPDFENFEEIPELQRPELKLFQLQSEALLAKSKLIEIQTKPNLYAYAQTGIGTPDPLNFFDNELSPYGIIGASFSWRITDWKRNKKEKELLSLEALKIQHQKENFEFNMEALEPEYLAEINRLKNQMAYDVNIENLQNKILETMSVQLDEGIITATEYIIQLNSELQAQQNLIIHQTQLLQTKLEFWNIRGKL